MKPVQLTRALVREPAQTLSIIETRARVAARNLGYRLGGLFDGRPLPPARLADLVIGSRELAWFHLGGMFMAQSITRILQRNGTPFGSFASVLDFGCGCGRLVRWLATPARRSAFWGCDYNPDLVRWCQGRLSRVARFKVNQADPPLPFDGGQFDLVYSYSVLTHLSGDRQGPWMAELARVLRPGGRLLVTVHGKRVATGRGGLTPLQIEELESEGLLVVGGDESGTNRCAAFHTPRWMGGQTSTGLELVDVLEGGANDGSEQDIYLYRRI